MMKTILAFSIALGVMLVFSAPAPADIIILNNGQVYIGKVSSAASDRLKLTTDYGEYFFPRNQVAGFYLTAQGMEAESYYQAGRLVLSKGNRDTARQLFERCVKYDASYRDKCIAALRGGPSTSPPVAGAPRTVSPPVAPAQPQATVVRLQCPQCSGTGVVMGTSALGRDSGGTERPRPCSICAGRGSKVLRIPPGYEICSDCAGFGATAGGGGSDRTGFTTSKRICPRCAGRGTVKAPWKPPEGTAGTESSGVVMGTTGRSPAPGTAPPRGAYNIARDRARSVASGRQPTRPIGPAAVRPVSPTIIEDTPPAGSGYEERADYSEEERIIDDGEGSSPDAVAEETSGEAQSEDASDSAPKNEQTGFIGKINKYKLYIILGGVAVLVFAVVFNKMSAKK